MKVSLRLRIFLFALLFLAVGHRSMATHLRAGEITVVRDACNSLTFTITVTVYTNTKNTPVLFGGDADISYIHFGDGDTYFVEETPNIIRYDLDPNGEIAMASVSVTHTYSSAGTYKIWYQEPNRNAGVLNMTNSVGTLFYIETLINIDPFVGCSDSPILSVPPIDKACIGAAWTHNPGASDSDGDSLSYEMVIPNSAQNTNVVNYRDPNNASFYLDFAHGSEDGGIPTFKIDSVRGTITWDAPGKAGEYNIAFVVKEWRKIRDVYRLIGFVRRDMQIIVEECENNRPTLDIPEELCVIAGKTLNISVIGSDPDVWDDSVKVEAFSEIFAISNASPATMTYSPPNPNTPKYEKKPTDVRLKWQTVCAHVKDQPYVVVFKVTDRPPKGKGAKLATFATMTIRVIGPPPEWDGNPVLNPGQRSVTLKWKPYECPNAEFLQLYRRVGCFAITSDSCDTGIPDNAGYELIKQFSLGDGPVTTYTDDDNGRGLAPGASYSYRLVATYPSPRGGISKVSAELCTDPFLIDAPVITRVSVLKTSTTAGKIKVSWVKPIEADPIQFPEPYQYRIFRGEGFTGPFDTAPIATVNKDSIQLSIIDSVNLNTEENVYHYRVVAFANSGTDFLDSSKMASSVRLEAKSLLGRIELTWNAKVPWSNETQYLHDIYRGDDGQADGQLSFLTTVDVREKGAMYIDGETTPLVDSKIYCYRIVARGSYGTTNVNIPDPLINYSQTICAQPGDSTAPCKPITPIALSATPCEEYILRADNCDNTNNRKFTNTISWERPEDEACRIDIAYYEIFYSSSSTGEFILLKSGLRTTTYDDENLPSFARCYKIRAVDRSGNASELSEAVCFDNCPYYELPNVFTPNLDACNGFFSAYSSNDRYKVNPDSEDPIYICGGVTDPSKCARFVERVAFRVYNRWGKEVYSYVGAENDDVNTIYIDWDGRADDGSDLSSGVYYYVAEVTFDSVYPSERQKTIKGWVHLFR